MFVLIGCWCFRPKGTLYVSVRVFVYICYGKHVHIHIVHRWTVAGDKSGSQRCPTYVCVCV